MFGDVLVRRSSAAPPPGADGEPIGDGRHVQGASHFHLLNHPNVYEHLREWLGSGTVGEGAEISLEA